MVSAAPVARTHRKAAIQMVRDYQVNSFSRTRTRSRFSLILLKLKT